MFKLNGMLNKFLLSTTLMFVFTVYAHAQDRSNDATKNQRTTTASGRWYTGGTNTSFVSVGQMGTSTLLTVTDGQTEYQASFGFVVPLVAQKEPNRPPVALSPPISVSLVNPQDQNRLKPIRLNGNDPDNDPIDFVITEQPKKGTLTAIGTSGREFRYTPNANLIAGRGIKDTLRFKVTETSGDLESDIALFPFEFDVNDVAHTIESFSMESPSTSTKKFSFTLEDNVLNPSYEVTLSYVNNGNLIQMVKQNLTPSELNVNGNSMSGSFEVSSSAFPDIFSGDFISGLLEVKAGEASEDKFELFSNTTSSIGNTTLSSVKFGSGNFIRTDKLEVKGNTQSVSTDGDYFTFASRKSTPENSTVELNIYAVELGDFDLSKAEFSISKSPLVGAASEPVLVRTSNNLAQWVITYTTTGEEGYADSLQFSVNNVEREFTSTNYAVVDVVGVNDAPSLSSINDQELDEDATLTVSPVFSDVDSNLGLSVTSSDSDNIPVNVNGNSVVISPIENYSGSATISVVVTETDNDEPYSLLETFDVTVNAVNDRPVISAISNQSIDEDNTFTYTLETTDVDATVALFSYSVTPSVQGVVTTSVSGNTLTVTPEANYNGQISFNITADDGLGTSTSVSEEQAFNLTINAVNDAPVVSGSIPTQNIVEGLPSYTIDLGQYFEDVETADSDLTFSLGATSSLFNTSISNDILTVEPKQGQTGTENIVITTSDGSLSASQTVTFNLTGLGASITTGTISNVDLNEDFGSSTIDLTGVFTDNNDAGAVFTYTLVGLDNITSSISGNTLTINSSANYNGTEKAYVLGSTNGSSAFVSFDIVVNPVNDAPTLTAIEDQSIQEDFALSNVFIEFEDIDTGSDNLTYQATSSNESIIKSEDISISKGTSGITLSANPIGNANGDLTLTVKVTDDGQLSNEITFEVSVLSINDDPEANSNSLTDATEDSAYSYDPDNLFSDIDGDDLTYTLQDNPDWLTISNNVLRGTPTNDNVGSSSFIIIAQDGSGATARKEYALAVINTNDAPTLTGSAADITATEDILLSSLFDESVFQDVDNDNLTLVASFTGADWLQFDSSTKRFSGTPTNSDVGTVAITVTATDPSGASISDNIVLTVVNTNDTPTDIDLTGNTIIENQNIGTVVGSLSTSDVDANDTFSYSISETSVADAFLIDGTNLVSNKSLDFEANETITIKIVTQDAAQATYEEEFVISITNLNEAPSEISLSQTSIAENESGGTAVGTLSSTDQDAGDTFTYELVSGTGDTNNDQFTISSGNLISNSSFDFEAQSTYSVRIKTTDAGGLSTENNFTIAVTDANDAPTDLAIDSNSMAENTEVGSQVGLFSSTDQDTNDTFTYTLVSGTGDTDNASFEISDNKLLNKVVFDFETKTAYSVRIAVTDAAGASYEESLNINVENVLEASIADIEDITFDPTIPGESIVRSFAIQNTGEVPIEVSAITLPEGYTSSVSTLTIGVKIAAEVKITFSPTEAQAYNGEIVVKSNAGETVFNVIGEGVQVTAIDDEYLDPEEANVYPNPSSDYIRIDLTNAPVIKPTISIIDLKGEQMWSRANVKEKIIDISVKNYPVGTYLIRINSERGTIVKKFMVIK